MHQSGSVSLCRSAISVLVATALYSPIALASTVEYGETVDGVVLEKDIQLVYGTANNTKINPGGEQHIKEFGVSNNTEINGGYQYIEMNGAAEYSVLNDGYQIVQMGGAANQTTINNGVLQVYGAANDPTIKGGRLIVEKDGGTVFAAIEKGGLLEVKEGGFAFAVDQKAGGAIKATTRVMEVFGTNRLGQFEIKNGIANNMLLENGGSLRVEENDFAYNTTVDSGGLLEVMDGGTVTGVDKKAGGKLIVSTNALEVSGPNSKGQFSIKDGVSKNYELDDGSGLIVMEDTQAIDTILDKHATMQSLGKDTGTKVQANAVYDLGRSYQNGSITYSSKAISENMVINNGRANVWAGTMVNVSVRGNDGILEVMKPQINYAPAMLVGKVVVSEGASFRTHGAVDTSKADVSLENSVWTIIADITTTNQNTLLNLANLAMSDANVNTTPSCVSICTMLVCPPTMVTHAHFSPFQTLAREKRISSQGSWILTETFPAASSALASAIACAVASFSTSSPALAFPPNAPSAAAIGSPTIPVPGTVTPRPFFIRFGETQASTRSTGPSSSAAATAASASEIGSVHPSAGFTSS